MRAKIMAVVRLGCSDDTSRSMMLVWWNAPANRLISSVDSRIALLKPQTDTKPV